MSSNDEDSDCFAVAMSQDTVLGEGVPMSQDVDFGDGEEEDKERGEDSEVEFVKSVPSNESEKEKNEQQESEKSKAVRKIPTDGSLHRNVRPIKYTPVGNAHLIISQGNIVRFSGDAIVNAANEGCLGGGGVDGAITAAGGRELAKARLALPLLPGSKSKRCRTGDAVITVGGSLAAKFCIHAVGPNYLTLSDASADARLESAYRNAMLRAKENNVKTVCFSLISAGVFRGSRSLRAVLRIGIEAVVQSVYEGLEEVHFLAFSDTEKLLLCSILDQIVHP